MLPQVPERIQIVHWSLFFIWPWTWEKYNILQEGKFVSRYLKNPQELQVSSFGYLCIVAVSFCNT